MDWWKALVLGIVEGITGAGAGESVTYEGQFYRFEGRTLEP